MPKAGPAPRFNRYLPLKAFQGGMGVVELCADMVERQPVALKTFLPELLSDAEAREQFVREASIWIEIGAHPHVVQAHQVRREGDRIYVVCEFVAPPEGVSSAALRAWLRAPLDPRLALDFALGIVRGMQWATTRIPGLVHRDLKPENVLVGQDRRAKVTDFGLALVRGQAEAGFCGTPAYMAPEQWGGAADIRSDIYAFGLILLEMLTGWTGITGRTLSELGSAHRGGAALRAAQHGKFSDVLRPLIQSAVAADPAQRPASWGEVEQALRAAWPALSSAPPPALPTPGEASRQQQILQTWSHNALANALADLGHLQDAVNGYRAVLERARALGDAALEAAALGNLGQTLVAMGDLDGALAMLESSLTIKRALGDRFGEGRSLTNRGNAWVRKGRLAEGLADYEQAARIFAELGQSLEHTSARVNMIPVLAQLGRVDEALAVGRECSESLRVSGDRRGQGAVLGSLGQILRRRGSLDEALSCSDLALDCFRSAADRLGEARELSFQGHTLRAMKRMPDALERFQQSAKLAEQCGDTLLAGSVYYALAELTPPIPSFAALGLENARRAAAAYRTAGREDLAADADQLAQRFGH